MNSTEVEPRSIMEIFNELHQNEKTDKCCSKDYDVLLNDLLNELNKASISNELSAILHSHQSKAWKKRNASNETDYEKFGTSASERANVFYKIYQNFNEISKKTELLKSEFSLLADCFEFYSHCIVFAEEYLKQKCVENSLTVQFVNYFSFLPFGAITAAALAANCDVRIFPTDESRSLCTFIECLLVNTGVPQKKFFVDNPNEVFMQSEKLIYCGSYSSIRNEIPITLNSTINYLCPNNTASFILESGDLYAAADQIISNTWTKNSYFGVSTVVVQESVHQKFIKILNLKLERLTAEHKDCSKFKAVEVARKLQEIVEEAIEAGASVQKSRNFGSEWGPTFTIDYQTQDACDGVPILNVLLCRTAKEGITLLNNSRYSLATSVWSEISSQALEISSQLICSNVWINCHGIFKPDVPLQSFGWSGNSVLGGLEGFLEYTPDNFSYLETYTAEESFTEESLIPAVGFLAQQAFSAWRKNKTRRQYVIDIADKLTDYKNLNEIIKKVANLGHVEMNLTQRNFYEEFTIVRRKIPIGVICIYFGNNSLGEEKFIELISAVLVMGNAIILVLPGKIEWILSAIEKFQNILPKNVLNVFTDSSIALHVALDPNVQGVWLFEGAEKAKTIYFKIKKSSAGSFKHIWMIPEEANLSREFLQTKCLKNKIVWLTNIDQVF